MADIFEKKKQKKSNKSKTKAAINSRIAQINNFIFEKWVNNNFVLKKN